MDMERLYRKDHALFKIIVGDFNAKIGPKRTAEELHNGTHGMELNEQGERLSEFIMSTHTIHGNSQFQKPSHLRWTWESTGGQFHNEIDHIVFNRRFCLTDVAVVPKFYTGSLELIRQREIARATGNHQQTSELAKLCREAIKEDLKERRAAAVDEAAEAGKSIRKARRSFANYKTKTTSLRYPDGTVTASRRAMEIIYDFCSDLFDSHVYLPTHHLRVRELLP
uniref:Endo/exonuclease/phosphatase domain-containing protein n=1 Tax=Haemonchus contortus TaxID=6289 RepID=A0A7I4XXK0_HAECO